MTMVMMPIMMMVVALIVVVRIIIVMLRANRPHTKGREEKGGPD
jgi:uncharacterized membrane protein